MSLMVIMTMMIMIAVTMIMVMMCVHRESIERVYEENSYLGERTR